MKNTLEDLNNHLFEQLERLNDDELMGEDLEKEISRSSAMTKVAQTIINNNNMVLGAIKHADEYGKNASDINKVLKIENKKDSV